MFQSAAGVGPGRVILCTRPCECRCLFQSAAGVGPGRVLVQVVNDDPLCQFQSAAGVGPGRVPVVAPGKAGALLFQSAAGVGPGRVTRNSPATWWTGPSFNPRPGSAPAESPGLPPDHLGQVVSIRGRGRPRPSRLPRRDHRPHPPVSIRGRGRPRPSPPRTPRPSFRPASFNPRPGSAPAESRRAVRPRQLRGVSIRGRGRPRPSRVRRLRPGHPDSFNPRPGSAPAESVPRQVVTPVRDEFQSAAGVGPGRVHSLSACSEDG